MSTTSMPLNIALLILRVVSGLMMLFGHGWMKLQNVLSGNWGFINIAGIPPQVSLIFAILVEVGAALLLIVGFRTRIMAGLLFLVMAGALMFYHLSDPLFAANAKGGGSKEMAVIYGVIFLALTLTGGGKYSLARK